jgi:hypothetical protein
MNHPLWAEGPPLPTPLLAAHQRLARYHAVAVSRALHADLSCSLQLASTGE